MTTPLTCSPRYCRRPMNAPVHILGPQRPEPNLRKVLDQLDVDGPVVVISAGWRHDEDELGELTDAVGPVTSIPLYRWFDEGREHAADIRAVYRERQERIGRFKSLYRLRVNPALATVRDQIRRVSTDPELVLQQVESATRVVRGIDAEALAAVDEVRDAYTSLADRFDNPWVRDRRDEAQEIIENAGVVLIAGGHVAVLRNRMLFFGVEHPLRSVQVPIVSWGAGSMALTRRIVLFYDDPPEGPGEAEVLDHGLGLIEHGVLFPHARRRLRLDDAERVAALARRFAPEACLGLEHGAWVTCEDGRWVNRGTPESAFTLQPDGAVTPVESA